MCLTTNIGAIIMIIVILMVCIIMAIQQMHLWVWPIRIAHHTRNPMIGDKMATDIGAAPSMTPTTAEEAPFL
jgi:hypothetical protein